jgi:endonuclease/exonuclease/phosphatase family metal-dependent hydrolase
MRVSQIRSRMELTLLTINTWKCDGDYYNRREVLTKALQRSGADVILCQECFQTINGSIDTLEHLSAALHIPAYAAPARKKQRLLSDRWIDSYSGLGALTALPVTNQTVVELPSNEADGGRNAQLLTIDLGSGIQLLIANIHLTHLPDHQLRRRQLQTVIQPMLQSKAAFRIIGGDWNTDVATPILDDMMETAQAADCYVLGEGTAPRYSLLSFFQKGIPVCVDHFFTLPSGTGYPNFVRAGVVLDQPDVRLGLYPSDHFGIRVTLTY